MSKHELEFKEGQSYRCTRDVDGWFTKGKIYPVVKTDNGLVILDDERDEWNDYNINDDFYNEVYDCFELVTVEQTEEDENMNKLKLKEGQLYKCIADISAWFTEGKNYPVVRGEKCLVVLDDDSDEWTEYELNDYFYKQVIECFELVTVEHTEENNTMNKLKLKVGQLYKCVNSTFGFTKGQYYHVVDNGETLVLIDDYKCNWTTYELNDCDFYENEVLTLVTVEQLDCEQEDESGECEPDQVETRTITVYYPNNEKLTFYGIVSVDEYDEGELFLKDKNDDEHVVDLKHALAYSNVKES